MKITVIDARLDRDVELMGKMDPYVVIENGDQKVKTATHDEGGKTPEWGEHFELEIADTKNMLQIKVCDD